MSELFIKMFIKKAVYKKVFTERNPSGKMEEMVGDSFKKITLKNGLRVITVPMPSVKSVTVMVILGAGSRYETRRISGLSHFLEHMAFKGTKKRPSTLEIASLIEGIGGEFNAATSKDQTLYYIKAASKYLPLIMDVLSDMLTNSLFKEEEIEREKGVILEEMNMREDMPMVTVGEVFEGLLYGKSALGRRIIGQKEVIKRLARQDFLEYLRKYYVPENCVVVIAGEIGEVAEAAHQLDAEVGHVFLQKQKLAVLKKPRPNLRDPLLASDKTLPIHKVSGAGSKAINANFMASPRQSACSLVEKYLGNWEKRPFKQFKKMSDKQEKPTLAVVNKKTEQAHLCLGVRAYPLSHPDRYPLSLLATILGGGMSSRLFLEVRERRGLAYYIKSATERFQDVGYFVTQAGVDLQRIEEAVRVILSEYTKIKNEKLKIKNEELKKAKEFLKGRLILELEDSKEVAALFCIQDILERKIETPAQMIKKVDSVTEDDVLRVAKDIFRPAKLNLAVIGPFKSGQRFEKLLEL